MVVGGIHLDKLEEPGVIRQPILIIQFFWIECALPSAVAPTGAPNVEIHLFGYSMLVYHKRLAIVIKGKILKVCKAKMNAMF